MGNGVVDASTRVTPVPFPISGLVRTREVGSAITYTSSDTNFIRVSDQGVINVSTTATPTVGQTVIITNALASDPTQSTNITIEFVANDLGGKDGVISLIGERLVGENGTCKLTASYLAVPRNFNFDYTFYVLTDTDNSLGLGNVVATYGLSGSDLLEPERFNTDVYPANLVEFSDVVGQNYVYNSISTSPSVMSLTFTIPSGGEDVYQLVMRRDAVAAYTRGYENCALAE